MLNLDRSSMILYSNPAGHDDRILVPGMSKADSDSIVKYAKDGGFHLYWGSRMSEYFWANRELSKFKGPIKMIDLGSGAAPWPHFVMDKYPGSQVDAVDQVGAGVEDCHGRGRPHFKAKMCLCGVEAYVPMPGYNVITAVSSIEHFSEGAKVAVAKMIRGLPVGGMVVVTIEMQMGPKRIAESMPPADVTRTLCLRPEDTTWILGEAKKLGLTNAHAIAMISGTTI